MELTPIKIPGKNTRRNTSKAALAARKALKRPRGRPLKLPCPNLATGPSLSSVTVAMETKKRSLKNIKSRRRMSDLEKLHTELLETVFLYCMNLDLPRSSPVIAGKLSSPSIHYRTIKEAFGPTWEAWHGKERDRNSQEDLSGGDPILQSAILRCRWASLSVILKTKNTWIQRHAQQREFKPLYLTKPDGRRPETSAIPIPISGYGASTCMSAENYLTADFARFSDFAAQVDGNPISNSCTWGLNTDVADGVEIPNSLLLGPWTEDMIKHLFWVIKSGAKIDWIHSTSGEVALSGLRTAIMEGETRAIHLLHWAGLIEKLDVNTIIWALENAGGNKLAVIKHLLRLGFAVLRDPDARKLGKVLGDLEDSAMGESNQEKLDFVKAVLNCQTLQGVSNLQL